MRIVNGLCNDDIVIVNSKTFSETILSAFNNSIFYELSKRNINNSNCISIFIDEAQRVLSKDFNIGVDVLRESKIELFLSFQNSELLIEKLGKNKFNAIYKNMKNRYLFTNPVLFENYDLSILNTFEYYDDSLIDFKVYTTNSLFIDSKESFKAELEFQKLNKIKSKYSLSKNIRNSILLYDKSLIEDNKIVLRTINNNEIVVNLYESNTYKNSFVLMNKMISKNMSTIKYNNKLRKSKNSNSIPSILDFDRKGEKERSSNSTNELLQAMQSLVKIRELNSFKSNEEFDDDLFNPDEIIIDHLEDE